MLLLTVSVATLCVQFKAIAPVFDQSAHHQQWALYPAPTSGLRVLPILTESRLDITNNVTFGAAVSRRLNWKTYEQIIDANDEEGLLEFARQVYLLAFDFATMEPKTPVDTDCRAPPLPRPFRSQCSPLVSDVFNGRVRSSPRKVGHAIQLGFDVDTLEIHLHELAAVVDKFFIVEWTMPHNRRLHPKPLAWEAVKGQARFAFIREKVIHIVMDDVDTAYTDPNDQWSVEALQEQRRWEKIVEWNQQTKFFGDDDLIGFGDTDEIASRNNVQLLKHCEWKNNGPVDIGIWFPMGRINQAFRTDQPVGGHPYSLGDPTFHLFQKAKMVQEVTGKAPSRNRGDSPNAILGGAHFSHYGKCGGRCFPSAPKGDLRFAFVYQAISFTSCSRP